MATARLVRTSDGISEAIDALIERGRTMTAYLNRVAYPQYQQAQVNRWESENASEGSQWGPLSERYLAQKRVRAARAGFPGGGEALMVFSGKLSAAAMGRGPGSLKVVTENSLTVGIDDGAIPYGKYTAEKRPFMEFGDATTEEILGGAVEWVMNG